MGNVLDNISKENTRFTIFENDQVLTADQLNDLINYLDIQSRLTRSQAIGVGIICGLEIGRVENSKIVVSKGSAITTDGDLLFVAEDLEFDQFELFEDQDANYSYFQTGRDTKIPVYSLSKSKTGEPPLEQALSQLELDADTSLDDYIGILYLEDYHNDLDVCSGSDCDNKGIEANKEQRVLLVHKNNVRSLLQSLPSSNKEYFSMTDIAIPRIKIQTSIDTYKELQDAFNNSLSMKDLVKQKLKEAYQICKLMLEDQFEGVDPSSEWDAALDKHFTLSNSIYVQYLYDFVRDLSYAFNELRESLFSGSGMCHPEVGLFPKHVLLGLVKKASIQSTAPPTSPLSSPLADFELANFSARSRLFENSFPLIRLRFNDKSPFRRFNTIHIDLEYRHLFYPSPVFNQGKEGVEQTRFCFMRIHSVIKNFKIPTAEELQNVAQHLKITPSHFEDRPLGERSIPFYYQFSRNLPVHLYWNFNANVRKSETLLLSYSANLYSDNPATYSPLDFNLLPYGFFRIEGHIGFKLNEVEASLNRIILENNLPINILSVQVERKRETIPVKPWFFPHFYLYEQSMQHTFLDRLEKTELVNDELKVKDSNIPTDEYKVAKQAFITNKKDVGDPAFNFSQMRTSVSDVITAAANIKSNTKQYSFSNAATPHDFVSNTDVVGKTDLLFNLYQQQIFKKKDGLMLGNFMKNNPGLEHAGGVLRGGTFVLVYTAEDKRVVADFMLPYANVDKDLVADPPVYQPLPRPDLPVIKFPVGKVFEAIPLYKVELDKTVSKYAKLDEITGQINTKVNEKFVDVESKFDLKLAVTDSKVAALAPQLDSFDARLKDSSALFNNVFTSGIKTAPQVGSNFRFDNQDVSTEMLEFTKKQKELESTAPDAPDRLAKEMELIEAANVLTEKINQPAITENPENSLRLKGIVAEIMSGSKLLGKTEVLDQSKALSVTLGKLDKSLKLF